jgi:hypothetical protein
MKKYVFLLTFAVVFFSMIGCKNQSGDSKMTYIQGNTAKKAARELVTLHGPAQIKRIELGIRQVRQFWQKEDGSAADFVDFCKTHFIADSAQLEKTFARFEKNFESLFGHLTETNRDLMESMDLDIGPMLPVDYLFAEYSPFAHVTDDLFKTKIAFVALLNFTQTALEDKLKLGPGWNRRQWAESRLADVFDARVPSDVNQTLSRAYTNAGDYINNYNIFMHHLLDKKGGRPFPAGLKLISHWGLRDELKGQYTNPHGLDRQKMIRTVMERIIRQEIPKIVINDPAVDWQPDQNQVAVSSVKDMEGAVPPKSVTTAPEPDTRYAKLLEIFRAERKADPYYPLMPTLMSRRFEQDREIPEAKVAELLKSVLGSEEVKRVARFIEERLERKLEPFDIWYNGFKARSTMPESELDRIVTKKYPDFKAFEAAIPEILRRLDFSPETADFLASKIVVDPARGSGHASGAGRRADKAHLRTRIPSSGMNYKGYNIACHELGHNVEQVLSLNKIDHILLRGVPNTAFTEAFAFVFQNRDLELLGIRNDDPRKEDWNALDALWAAAEIGAVSFVDMKVWHWMYDHPDAKPAELKQAVIEISKQMWNDYFAPIFGVKDVILLGIYSHMIDSGLYLPDYPMGHIIAFQIEKYLQGKKLGTEMERMCKLGSITPDTWMQAAVGEPISARPLLDSAQKALDVLKGGP